MPISNSWIELRVTTIFPRTSVLVRACEVKHDLEVTRSSHSFIDEQGIAPFCPGPSTRVVLEVSDVVDCTVFSIRQFFVGHAATEVGSEHRETLLSKRGSTEIREISLFGGADRGVYSANAGHEFNVHACRSNVLVRDGPAETVDDGRSL